MNKIYFTTYLTACLICTVLFSCRCKYSESINRIAEIDSVKSAIHGSIGLTDCTDQTHSS